MLRDKNLTPLSRQHQHALAMCVRLNRALEADELDIEGWESEITQAFAQEIGVHFAAEEQEVFPQAVRFPELRDLVQELLAEHETLRRLFSRSAAHDLDPLGLAVLAEELPAHIRKEERQLFQAMQERMSAEALAAVGRALEEKLPASVCNLPAEPKSKIVE
jgi:hemerythrin-like domain-containing protein